MKKGKVYIGFRDSSKAGYVNVAEAKDGRVHQRPLKHVVRHSPAGFDWGFMGNGSADLANSILSDMIGDMPAGVSTALYQSFKHDVVARLPRDRFELSQESVFEWLNTRWSEMSHERISADLAVA